MPFQVKLICDDKWHKLVITWDGTLSINSLRIFVDDLITPKNTATPKRLEKIPSYNLVVGKSQNANPLYMYWFKGDISSLEIYDDVIEPTQTLENKSYSAYIRLPSGGITASDKDNEWDKIIVESNLNNNITAGDNNIWNWQSIASWTSTTPSLGADVNNLSTKKVGRGGASASTWATKLTSDVPTTTWGFRPVLIIESLEIIKYMILHNNEFKTLENDILTVKGNDDLPIEEKIQLLKEYGINDINKFISAFNQLGDNKKIKILKIKYES